MARRRSLKSISTPITLGAISVPICLALLVGWVLVFAQRLAGGNSAIAPSIWLLGVGAISFIVVMVVLVLLSYFLAREILEVRRQDSFIASVTHELKSPLASLKLLLETLDRDELKEPKRRELRVMMLDDVDRLSSFIDDVLQASRLSYGQRGTNLTEVPLRELVLRVAATVSARHKLKTDAVEVAIDDALVLHSDPAALEIVLKNLIDNALKYGRQGVVSVRARRVDSGTVVEVKDDGIGIAKQHLKRVFQRFYRVPSESVRERYGTGLGLFVVSALVKNLGGSVVASSEGEGRGTLMTVTLPDGGDA